MITARSSAVRCCPGLYKLVDVLRACGACREIACKRDLEPPKPRRERPPLKMTPDAIRRRSRRAERRKRKKEEGVARGQLR